MSGDNCKMRLERNLVPSLSATAVVSWMFPCIESEVLYPNLGVCILSTHSKACLSSSEELPLQDMRQNQLKDINQNVARRLSISDRSGKASSSIGVTWKTTKKKVQSKETTSSLNIRMIVSCQIRNSNGFRIARLGQLLRCACNSRQNWQCRNRSKRAALCSKMTPGTISCLQADPEVMQPIATIQSTH